MSTAPTSVVATSQGDGYINVQWTWATIDPTWISGTSKYEISYKTAAWHIWETGTYPTYYKNGFSATDNYTYQFRVRCDYAGAGSWSAYTYSNYCTRFVEPAEAATVTLTPAGVEAIGYTDTKAETITLTPAGVEVVTASDTCDEEIFLDDSGAGSGTTPLQTDFWHYFGDFDGSVYVESSVYKSDNGTAIDSEWESKDTEFIDQDVANLDVLKTVYKVRLWYVDVTAGASVSVSLSTDGGNSWSMRGKAIGTGSGLTKSAEFFFVKTGQFFRVRVENNSASDDFKWTGLEVFYVPAGDSL